MYMGRKQPKSRLVDHYHYITVTRIMENEMKKGNKKRVNTKNENSFSRG